MNTVVVILVAFCISAGLSDDNIKRVLFKDAEKFVARIVGGSPAQRYQIPYQVSIHLNNQHFCGGSILSEEWVVTAAHCILGPPSQMLIYAGMLNLRESHPDVQVSRVARVIVHPLYTGNVAPNDIALLQLSSPLRWTSAVKPIALPSENEEFSGRSLVSGWGYTTAQNQAFPTTLQQVQMQIWPFNHCANNLLSLMGSYQPLDNSMVCVGGEFNGMQTVCQGDSGGPLMQNGKLVGVTSWTLTPCGTYGAPSVYTKVSKFVRFIRQYVPSV